MPDCVFRNARNHREAKLCHQLEKRCYGPRSWHYSRDNTHILAAFLEDLENVVVAEIDGKLAGFYVVYGYNVGLAKHAQVLRFGVHPDLRRLDIGSYMLANACARAVHSEVDHFSCFVDEEDLDSQLFARSCGWICDKITTTDAGDTRYRFKWATIVGKSLMDSEGCPHFTVVPMGDPQVI